VEKLNVFLVLSCGDRAVICGNEVTALDVLLALVVGALVDVVVVVDEVVVDVGGKVVVLSASFLVLFIKSSEDII
jgi:hypothetical protein